MKAIIILLVIALFTLIVMGTQPEQNDRPEFTYGELDLFLVTDTTNINEWPSDAHAARELSYAAHRQGYSMGAAILGNHQTFKTGYDEVYNYVNISGEIVFISAQYDDIMTVKDIENAGRYRYIKLYPDGTNVPLNVRSGLSHDMDLINK